MKLLVSTTVAFFALVSAAAAVTPACAGYNGWNNQLNPATDASGLANAAFPEASSTTYWSTILQAAAGAVVTITGQYPAARFISFEITASGKLVDYIVDANIAPDPGQNNPFVSASAGGTYTAYVVFGGKPGTPAPNTLYTGTLTNVALAYRVYHTTDPNSPTGISTNPAIPELAVNGTPLVNCPVQPVIEPVTATPWGRLSLSDWHGTAPNTSQKLAASSSPAWKIVTPGDARYSPNGANCYMTATLSREFLRPATMDEIFVVRFKSPTFPNTRAGEPPYTPRQVRFWSLCTNDPYTTGVIRCLADDAAALDRNGYTTIVISDPGYAPSSTALQTYRAKWIAWGALDLSADVVYDQAGRSWGIDSPVHYYNTLIYRQTLADASFTQSMLAVSTLPAAQQKSAMGAYWPVSGYCTRADFETSGVSCLKK